jgi:hypothetical protein
MTGSGAAAPASGGAASGSQGPARLELDNEFASVAVMVDERANGPRLLITDLRNGRRVYLDPLELASLTWLTHDDLGPFLDPSRTGWRWDGAHEGGEGP